MEQVAGCPVGRGDGGEMESLEKGGRASSLLVSASLELETDVSTVDIWGDHVISDGTFRMF